MNYSIDFGDWEEEKRFRANCREHKIPLVMGTELIARALIFAEKLDENPNFEPRPSLESDFEEFELDCCALKVLKGYKDARPDLSHSEAIHIVADMLTGRAYEPDCQGPEPILINRLEDSEPAGIEIL